MGEGLGQARNFGSSATMRSRKLQVLDFVKRYYASWGHSPSLQEIAIDLGISKQRVAAHVRQLSKERQVEVVAGKARGIRLPDRSEELSEADVLLRLKQLGMIIPPPLTEKTLPELDYEP